jgi:formylglycine-generating enzyme required for sulfatase activity
MESGFSSGEQGKRQLIDAFEGVSVATVFESSRTADALAIEWRDIPPGTVSVESIVYRVKAFRMAKNPVTYAEFQTFIDSGDGYFNALWWAAMRVNGSEMIPGEQRWPIENHPREHVSWYEAVAFCRWLSHHTGLPIRLPTEQEWQRAAQGDDQRNFPWGDAYDDTSRCNTRERDLRQTSPVGSFPKGVSTYGVHDMAGNVWEWCLNEYEHSSRIGLHGTGPRVLRGGSWFSMHDVIHTTFRYFCLPKIRDFDVGFRVVCGDLANQNAVRPDLLLTAASLTRSFIGRLVKRIKKIITLS